VNCAIYRNAVDSTKRAEMGSEQLPHHVKADGSVTKAPYPVNQKKHDWRGESAYAWQGTALNGGQS